MAALALLGLAFIQPVRLHGLTCTAAGGSGVSVSRAFVPCLTEGLLRMGVGSRQRLLCPPQRDFVHPKVPVGSTLVYDIELLETLREKEQENEDDP